MTAICGSWSLDGRPGASDECAGMQRALALYGSDRSARWDGGDIAFGIQLARLVPEDRFDRQPLVGGGGRFTLVADARIDNRPELAAALGLPAEQTALMADAAYVLAAWERWGEGCLERLYGDFAFALWDSKEAVLRLVRDPMGNRPLFVHHSPGRVRFASMCKGLHALPEVPRAPDAEMLRDFLAFLPQRGPRSFFAGIGRVEPGQMLRLHADGRSVAVDWYDRDRDRSPRLGKPEEYVEAFREVFDRAVSDRLRTTGGVASHLSGGLDSTTVTATAAAILAGRGQRLSAFTHVPEPGAPLMRQRNRFGDEGPLAATVAARYPNIDHVLVDCAGRQVGDDFDSNFHYSEYPLLNPCNSMWEGEINRLAARRGARVMLTGAFGNQTLTCTGNERLAELLGQGRVLAWAREAFAGWRDGKVPVSSLVWRSFAGFLPGPVVDSVRRVTGRNESVLAEYSPLSPDVAASDALWARMGELGHDPRYRPRADTRWERCMVLWRVDFLCQHFKGVLASTGIDVRDPTRDRRLVEFSLNLPSDLLLRGGVDRWLFRKAFGSRLSPEVTAERRKGLQAADWATRLRRDLPDLHQEIERAQASPTAAALLDLPGLAGLARSGPHSDGEIVAEDIAYRHRFLRGVSAAHFLRKLEAGNQ